MEFLSSQVPRLFEFLESGSKELQIEFVFPTTWSYGLILALAAVLFTLFLISVALIIMIFTMIPSLRDFTQQGVRMGLAVMAETWSGEREVAHGRQKVTEIRQGNLHARIYWPVAREEQEKKLKQKLCELDGAPPDGVPDSAPLRRVASALLAADTASFAGLPDEIMYNIFRYFSQASDFVSLCRAAMVCHAWARVASDDSIWRPMFCRRWRVRSISKPIDVAHLPEDFEVAVVDWGPSERPRTKIASSRSVENLFHAAGRSLWKGQYEIAHKRERLIQASSSVNWHPIALFQSLTSIFETLLSGHQNI